MKKSTKILMVIIWVLIIVGSMVALNAGVKAQSVQAEAYNIDGAWSQGPTLPVCDAHCQEINSRDDSDNGPGTTLIKVAPVVQETIVVSPTLEPKVDRLPDTGIDLIKYLVLSIAIVCVGAMAAYHKEW